jgi:hypothetical protein
MPNSHKLPTIKLQACIIVVAMVVVFSPLFVTGAPSASLPRHAEALASPQAPKPVNTTLRISSKPVGAMSPTFWGVNVRADQKLGNTQRSYLPSTPVKLVRWPGGNLGECYNMTANGGTGLVYNDNGTSFQPPWTTAQFVSWCLSINCQAIFTVPAEIDNPAIAASFVTYVQTTLDFYPAYWEIGNEPSLWDHFGIPWSHWNTSQESWVTPTQYADAVQSYVSAMKVVNPHIRFIGLGGVGSGAYGEPSWINATVDVNGPNLTAVAIHVYPAGAGTVGESDAKIYSSVVGNLSLLVRIPRDLAAIRSSCPSCHIQLMVDEFNAASGNNLSAFMSGFQLVPYVAAELEQGICLNASSMEFWALAGGYAGSLFNSSGSARPVSTLYSALLPHLDSIVLRTSVTSALPNIYALATENTTANPGSSLLIANLNSTLSARILLTGSGFPVNSSGTVWLWNASSPAPLSQPLSKGSSSGWVLPPESVGLWVSGSSVSVLSLSLKASPSILAIGGTTYINASVANGVPPYTYTWLGLPRGCTSANASDLRCTPNATGTFTIRNFVNDSAGNSESATISLTVDAVLSIKSFAANPNSITVGQTSNLTVFANGGTHLYTYRYSGLPGGCTSSNTSILACTPEVAGIYAVRVYVNDSIGDSANKTTTLTVHPLCGLCIGLQEIDPSSFTIPIGGSANFTAISTCTATCPSGITYSWTLTRSAMGKLNATTGTWVTFAAHSTIGTVGLFVNATLDGESIQSSPAIITITAIALTSATVNPPSASLGPGSAQPFTANSTCNAPCPSGVTYTWTLTNSAMGELNATSGSSVTFTAGNATGTVGIFVNATLNGKAVNSSAIVNITLGLGSTLTSVAVNPSSASVVTGESQLFTATATCAYGTCPASVAYAWTLSNALGSLSYSTGAATSFTAGRDAGVVTLTVSASLYGRVVTNKTVITVTLSPCQCNAPGISMPVIVAAVVAVVVVMAVVAALLLARRGRSRPKPSESNDEEAHWGEPPRGEA